MVVAPTTGPDGRIGGEALMDEANRVLRAMVGEGSIADAEYRRVLLPAYYRTRAELVAPLAPAASDGKFALIGAEDVTLDDPLALAFAADGDRDAAADRYCGFVRAWTEPPIAAALDPARDAPARLRVIAEFFRRYRVRVAADPEAVACRQRLVVLHAENRG